MKAKGLTDERIVELAAKKGYELPGGGDLLSKATKATNKVFAGGKVGEAIGTLGGYAYTKAKDKIMGTDVAKYYDLSAPSPLQVAGDIAKGALQVAGPKVPIASTVAGKAAQFGALGAAAGGSDAIAQGKSVEDTVKATVSAGITGALTGATFGVVEKGAKALADGAKRLGSKIQYSVIKPTQADVEDGFDIATVKEFNLGGSLKDTFKKTNDKLGELSTLLNSKLAANKEPLDMNAVYERTLDRLAANKAQNFGSTSNMEGALERLRGEIINVVGPNGLSSIPEAQQIKRASGHFGAWTHGMTDPDSTAAQKVFNAFYHELKEEIERVSPEGVREINQQISRLIPIQNAVIRRIPIAERNAPLSLSDLTTLVGGTLEPRALSLSVANFLAKSGKFGNALTQVEDFGAGAIEGAERAAQAAIPFIPSDQKDR